MITYFLIRHATNDSVGSYITGRSPGLHLNIRGRRQANGLADRFADWGLDRLYVSPLERTRETAAPIVERLGIPFVIDESFIEMDAGEWTGRTFEELTADPRWRRYNTNR